MPPSHERKEIALGIATVGFTAIITQTILLREFLSVFYGNELVVGIVLAVWMILTGCGALLGRLAATVFRKIRAALVLFLLSSLLPLLTIFMVDYLRNLVFNPGEMIGVGESLYYSSFLLFPFCLVSGALFTLFAVIISEQGLSNRIPEAYAIEAIGGVVGGIVLNFFLILVFSAFQILCILALIDLGISLYLSLHYRWRNYQIAIVVVGAGLLILNARLDLDKTGKSHLFPGQELIYHKETPYGNLVITKYGNQKNFYENGSLLFVTGDVVSNEDAVHYAMVQHPDPRRVLLIAGGISGTTREILKYGVARIDYVELNPAIIKAGRDYTSALDDPRIDAISEDGRRFALHAHDRYDVVLVNVPDPSTAQINRYYTTEFFEQLKNKLTTNGVVSISLLESVDFMSDEARQLSSVVYNTLKSHFHNVVIIPGLRNHYVASDGQLTTNIAAAIAQRNIQTISVNRYYIDDELLSRRSVGIVRSLDTTADVNRDFVPVAYFRQLHYWLSYFGMQLWLPAVVISALFIVIITRLKPISLGMFTGGFAASAIEVILLISFQIIYGFVYQATGIIITAFMGGLATGAYAGKKVRKTLTVRNYAGIQIALAAYSFFLPLALHLFKGFPGNDILIYGVFFLLTYSIAVLVGVEFAFAARLSKEGIASTASILYGVDLVGSALGAFLIAIYILPLLGVTLSSVVVALVCLMSATVCLIAGRHGTVSPEGGISYV